jgi:hypothetical protein
MHIFGLDGPSGLFGGVSLSASEWAMEAVDKLAAVMGGRTLKVFREIHGWNAALHTFIALRLASAIAKHDQLNMALQTGLQLEGTLQILAAKKFLETAMGSIRLEVGSGGEKVASTILSSLAEEYTIHKAVRSSTKPRSREVDMAPPKGFALNFGAAEHIVNNPLLHIVLIARDILIVLIVLIESFIVANNFIGCLESSECLACAFSVVKVLVWMHHQSHALVAPLGLFQVICAEHSTRRGQSRRMRQRVPVRRPVARPSRARA